MFMMWTGTKQKLLIFLENLNCKYKTIKFEKLLFLTAEYHFWTH